MENLTKVQKEQKYVYSVYDAGGDNQIYSCWSNYKDAEKDREKMVKHDYNLEVVTDEDIDNSEIGIEIIKLDCSYRTY